MSTDQRTTPTVSRNTTAEMSVANSGAEKLIATALASGIRLKAIRMKVCEKDCEMLRAAWERSLSVRKTLRPVRGSMNIAQQTRPTAQRLNRTSSTE
jgi:hypothetical protein